MADRVFLEVPDQGGAKSTSCYVVEVLFEASVNGMLRFTNVVFMAEGAGDDVDGIGGMDGGEA